jgi:hypothetical protein
VRLRSGRVTWKLAGDEVIALQLPGYEYLAVRDSGAEVWQRLTEPVTPAELAAWRSERYCLDADRAQDDVAAFLEQLRERDLLELA